MRLTRCVVIMLPSAYARLLLNFCLFSLSYENNFIFTFGFDVLTSSEGFQQGDPLAVFGFCLGHHKELLRLKSRLCVSYIDDVTLGSQIKTVLSDLESFEDATETIGSRITPSKCEIFMMSDTVGLLYSPFAICAQIFVIFRKTDLFFSV